MSTMAEAWRLSGIGISWLPMLALTAIFFALRLALIGVSSALVVWWSVELTRKAVRALGARLSAYRAKGKAAEATRSNTGPKPDPMVSGKIYSSVAHFKDYHPGQSTRWID